MKLLTAAAAIPLLIALLTWLSLRAVNPEAELYDRVLAELDHFAMLEAALHRDVLSARAGALRNYDPLVRETNALRASLDRMRQGIGTAPALGPAIDRLTDSVNHQEEMVEQFKSNNALLQNSLAYFSIFSFRMGTLGQAGALRPAVTALATSMLRLTLDTSSAVADDVQDHLDELANTAAATGSVDVAQGLLAHGRLLHDLLPETDRLLSRVGTVPLKSDQATLRTLISTGQSSSRETARQFRNYLYLTSLILVGLLAYLGLQLRARARALHRRAAFEHVVAGISMRFINSEPQQLDAHIEQALADMTNCVGADRAYYQFNGSTVRTYLWCRAGIARDLQWPGQARTLMSRYDAGADGIAQVSRVSHLAPGQDRTLLVAAGVQGWACVTRTDAEGARHLLGFDTVSKPSPITREGELGLLRMALDAIANAVARQHLEQERVRLETRLQHARRLETLGAFASGVAHNFNNIIGAILGYTEMANEQAVSRGQESRLLGEIKRAGERARELVDQVLNFGRRQEANRWPVNIQTLVDETISLLRASWPASVELTLHGASNAAMVSGSPTQLQQVLLNICNNAAQAMDNAGRIELNVDLIDQSTVRPLSHGTLLPGRYVVVAVSDRGVGINKANLRRIFEPFFSTRTAGNGLGLATSFEIVREHGGALNVMSTPGQGSRFEIWLPRITTTTAAATDDSPAIPRGRGETVLVVESDPERLLRDEEMLAALGYEPVGFEDPMDAQAACRAAPERFDAVVLSSPSSEAEAHDLIRTLHMVAPRLPILLATASADAFDADGLMAAGIADIVSWPITAAEMATALEHCLRQTV